MVVFKEPRQEDLKFEASLEYIARFSPAKVKKIRVGVRVKDESQGRKLSSQAFARQTAHRHTL